MATATLAAAMSLLLVFLSAANSYRFPTMKRTVQGGHALLRSLGHRRYIATLISNSAEGIASAASEIRRGGLVAFPTETVYGLGANIYNESSVNGIFHAKKRPLTDPLIVHIHSKEEIADIFDFSDDMSGSGTKARTVCDILAEAFWPGPLTMIYKAKQSIPLCISAGTGFVGLRCPSHPIALALLKASALPIAAPSANRFGHVSPTSAQHVLDDLGGEDIMVLQDDTETTGGCKIGIESTVCRVSRDGDSISILRCGAITSSDITRALESRGALTCRVSVSNERTIRGAAADNGAAVAPGQMIKHYAPDVPTYILKITEANRKNTSFRRSGGKADKVPFVDASNAFVLDFGGLLLSLKATSCMYVDISPEGSVDAACGKLFMVLRQAESAQSKQRGVTYVILADLSAQAESDDRIRGLWERLHRAASGEYIV